MLVDWRGYGHIGNTAHICKIERAVMCHAVFTPKPGSVETKDDRQVLYGDVMYNFVESPLHKR